MIRRESWPSVRSCAGSPELRQLSQPDQIPGVPGATDARSISGDSDPQRLRTDRASDRSWHHQRLAVDADRNLVGVGVDDHLESGALSQTVLMRPMEQPDGLTGTADGDRDDSESAPVQSRPMTEPRQVVHLVRAVADQHSLWTHRGHARGARSQHRSGTSGEEIREHLQEGAGLGVAVLRTLDYLGVRPERCVVDESSTADISQIHRDLDAVDERVEAPRRILEIEPQIRGEVVARSRADDEEGQVVFGRDSSNQCLCSVATGHTE